jgi:superfamily II DNA helicase RecQ
VGGLCSLREPKYKVEKGQKGGWVASTRIHSHLPPRHVQKILQGEYQVVISSPEAFLDTDKLRNVIQASELKDYRQFVVVDEAHVIQTWSKEFRKAYGLVGNLRSMLFDVPFSAVTATATVEIKAAIISALHLGSQKELVETNLGNFRSNIEYSVHRMRGGAKSYKEITQFFPCPEDVGSTLVWDMFALKVIA